MPGGKKVQDDKKSEVQQIKKDEVSDQKPNHETKIENVVQEEIIRVNGAELEQTEKPQQLEMSNEKEEYDLKPEEEQKLVSILTALQELASSRPPNRKTKTTRRKKLKETTTTTIQDQEPTTFHIEMVQKYPMFCEMFCKWYKLIDLQFDYDVLETCYHAISLVDIYLNAAKNICTKTDLTINSRVLHHFYSKAWVQMNRTGEKLGDNCMREIAEASKTIFQNKSIADQCTLCEQICTYIDQMITTEVENHERLHPSKTWTKKKETKQTKKPPNTFFLIFCEWEFLMSPQLPVWFIVLFVFLMIGLIVCIIILFLQVNKKNVSPPGPAGPQGLRGEVGFTGLRGEQGYQGPIGFQGVQGNNATFSTVSGVVVLTARAPLPAPLAVLIQNQVRVQFFYIRRIAGINFYSLDTTMVGSGIIIAPNPVLATNTFSFIIDTVDPIPADVENIINFMGTATCTNTNDGENAILTSVQRDTPRQFRLIYTTGTGSIRNIQPTSNYFCNFQLNFFGQAFFP